MCLVRAGIEIVTGLYASGAATGNVQETVTAAREGGASLDILSGFVAGNFSAFWLGIIIAALM